MLEQPALWGGGALVPHMRRARVGRSAVRRMITGHQVPQLLFGLFATLLRCADCGAPPRASLE